MSDFDHWTQTARDLYNDPQFLIKRLKEQRAYIMALNPDAYSPDRFCLLLASAKAVESRLTLDLWRLKPILLSDVGTYAHLRPI